MQNSGQGTVEATAISAGETNSASGGAMPPDDETNVKDSTTVRSVPNKDVQLTRKEFETNLENNGFTRKPTSNETITNYLKDDMKYTVRDVSKSRPGDVTVDVYRSNQLIQKIRLTGKPQSESHKMNHSLQWSSDIARMKAELSWLDAVFVAEPEAQLLSSKAYRVVATIDSGRVFSRRFYEAIRCWGRQGAVGPAFLVVRSPDPIAYYWGDFGVVPLVEISMSTSGDLFLETLHFEPSGGADSISTLAEEFVFF